MRNLDIVKIGMGFAADEFDEMDQIDQTDAFLLNPDWYGGHREKCFRPFWCGCGRYRIIRRSSTEHGRLMETTIKDHAKP